MLAVILKILGIIGLILLLLLAFIIIVILLVLFFPVKYRISASKYGESIHADIKFKWLFGFLRARYQYPQPGKVKVKLLCFHLFSNKKQTVPQPEPQKESVTEEKTGIKNIPLTEESAEEETDFDAGEEKKSIREKILSKYENIKYTIEKICGKIKYIWNNVSFYKELLFHEDTKALIGHFFKRFHNILKKVKPKKIKADILFGTGQPDTTGYVLGVYSVLSTQIQNSGFINVSPDFENAVIEGNITASGHFRIYTLLKNVIMLILDKRLKELLTKFKEHKADVEPFHEQKGK